MGQANRQRTKDIYDQAQQQVESMDINLQIADWHYKQNVYRGLIVPYNDHVDKVVV